jgi:hypothetical protein
MKIIKQTLSNLFSSCFNSNFDITRGEPTQIINHSDALQRHSQIYITPSYHNLNSTHLLNQATQLQPQDVAIATQSACTEDLLLINKPSTYSKLLENFINYHGPNSDQVKNLISPELDFSDRAFNIHIITGSNTHSILHNTLRNKSSLNKLLDSEATNQLGDMIRGS